MGFQQRKEKEVIMKLSIIWGHFSAEYDKKEGDGRYV